MGAGVSGVPGLSVVKTAALLETEHAMTHLQNMGAQTAQEMTQVIVIVNIISATSGVIDQCTVQTEADKSRPQR